jgi:D-3-phosphoglycerate dehydrogenase
VLLINPLGREGVEMLQQIADVIVARDIRAETLLDCARDADAILVCANLPPNIFDAAARLRGVVCDAVGLDMIPVEAATAKGTRVANMPGANAESVAEHVVNALLLIPRRVHLINHTLRSTDWNSARAMAGCGRSGSGCRRAPRPDRTPERPCAARSRAFRSCRCRPEGRMAGMCALR